MYGGSNLINKCRLLTESRDGYPSARAEEKELALGSVAGGRQRVFGGDQVPHEGTVCTRCLLHGKEAMRRKKTPT